VARTLDARAGVVAEVGLDFAASCFMASGFAAAGFASAGFAAAGFVSALLASALLPASLVLDAAVDHLQDLMEQALQVVRGLASFYTAD